MVVIPESAGVLAAASAFGVWAVRGKSSTVFAPSVWQGPADKPSIALTFDDGPSESTPELLDVLANYSASATFFQCGMHVRRLPQIARRVAEAGHELGNHTDSHPALYFKSATFIQHEIAEAQTAIASATGIQPRYFRPPYGARWFGLRKAQAQFDLQGVLWTTIGRDWRLTAGAVSRRLVQSARNGAILCLHDGRAEAIRPDIRTTLDAVRSAIPLLLDHGFHFVTVSELLCLKPQHPMSPSNPSRTV
ncbi:MAG: polysaccharide deacetylase family protein [Bryobacteraceae bacterium]